MDFFNEDFSHSAIFRGADERTFGAAADPVDLHAGVEALPEAAFFAAQSRRGVDDADGDAAVAVEDQAAAELGPLAADN